MIRVVRSPWHTGPENQFGVGSSTSSRAGLLNTKAWGHATDILGGAVYVVYVDCVEIVRRLDAPIAWPHTVIFVDRGFAERLRPAVPPRIVCNFT